MMTPFSLQTREMRKHLEVRDKPYYVRVTSAVHLGYRKGKSIARWLVRKRTGAGYRTQILRDVVPDDRVRANGSSVLSYQQAIIWALNMNTDDEPGALKCCGFCGKSQDEVNSLIEGSTTCICDECVVFCNQIISEREPASTQSLREA